jgi:hypothetical protein
MIRNFSSTKKSLALKKIKHKAAFEAFYKSFDDKGFLIAMETPLKSDGNNLGFTKTSSHIRFTYFDKTLKKAPK